MDQITCANNIVIELFFLFRAQIRNDMQIAMEAEKLWKFLGIFLQIELRDFAFFPLHSNEHTEIELLSNFIHFMFADFN